MTVRLLTACALLLALAAPLAAHPVPAFSYDRTVRVRLTPEGVAVEYLVELTDFTVLRDIDKLVDDRKLATLKSGEMLRDAFKEAIAPLLADRLEASQGERPLTFQCRAKAIEKDPAGNNPRYRFEFFAPWPEPSAGSNRFRLQLTKPIRQEEINLEKGRIDLAFAEQQGMDLAERKEPPTALKDIPDVDRGAAEEQQLRELSATFALLKGEASAAPEVIAETPVEPSIYRQMWKRGPAALLESNLGLGLLLLLAAGFGAAHALTPGHGKTLVAAYLVGQRGTVWHALLLGLVTTITHTGIVLVLAALLPWLLSRVPAERVQAVLGFAGGLLVAGLGIWLLLRRLAGGADHVHIGGGHHHHHGPDGHHHHHHLPSGDHVRVWDLLVLGVSGGIVPCWDAIALLAMAIGTKQVGLGLPLLLAFSAGLAGVLVLIGVLVVKMKGFGSSKLGEGPLVRALPIVSAIAVTLLGLWLCFDSVSGP